MDFVDRTMARRLEAAEGIPQVYYAGLLATLRPEIGAAAEEIGGGHVAFAGVGSPVGRAIGAWLDRPFACSDLDHIEEFYRSHGAPAQVDVCPLHDAPLLSELTKRGYRITELNNVLWRRLQPAEHLPPTPLGVQIRRGRVDEAESLADIVTRSFYPKGDAPAGLHEILAPLYQIQGAVSLVATVDGKPVAAGGGMVLPQYGVMALFGAGTLEEFRGRGIQTALVAERLRLASAAGCEFTVVVTQGGTASQRNCERMGFRVAYSKATAVKLFEG